MGDHVNKTSPSLQPQAIVTALALIPWQGEVPEREAAIGALRCKLRYGFPGLRSGMPFAVAVV